MKIFDYLLQENQDVEKQILVYILRKPLAYYDKIYIFSPNLHQDKIQDLQELMQKNLKKGWLSSS